MGLRGLVYDLYVDNYEKLEKMCREIPLFAESLGLTFYFNRYSSGPNTSGPHFMRLGVLSEEILTDSPDSLRLKDLFERMKNVLDRAEKKFGAEVKIGEPDFRNIDGMLVDQIKMESTKTALGFKGKLTIPQIYLFIHFLMNQLGYQYKEELQVYSRLVENIAKNMGRKAKIEFEEMKDEGES
jgi:hypothetical protein